MKTSTKLNEAGTDGNCSCKHGRCVAIMLTLFLLAGVVCWSIHRQKPEPPAATPSAVVPTPLPAAPHIVETPVVVESPAILEVPAILEAGVQCIVQFRRDALGGATTLPVSPTAHSINGAVVSMQGKLLATDKEAILLEATKSRPQPQVGESGQKTSSPAMGRFWIPKSSILLLEYTE